MASHVQCILDDKVNEVYNLYKSIATYATSLPTDVTRGPIMITSIENLQNINIVTAEKSVGEIFIAAVAAFMNEAGTIDGSLIDRIHTNRQSLLSKEALPLGMIHDLVMIGIAMARQ